MEIESDRRYDDFGNLLSSKDALGHLSIATYDPDFQAYVWEAIKPVQKTSGATIELKETRTYDWAGRLKTVADTAGAVTSYDYDNLSCAASVHKPNGGFLEYRYLDYGDPSLQRIMVITVTELNQSISSGFWSAKHFDGNGLVWKRTQSGDNCRTILSERTERFVNQRRVISYSLPRYEGDAARWIEVIYNERDVPTRIDRSSGTTTTMFVSLSETGLVDWVDDAEGHRTFFYRDERRRVIRRVEPDLHSLRFEYDGRDRMTAVTLKDGSRETRDFDTFGRIVATDGPRRGQMQYQYDDVGNLRLSSDPLGHSIVRSYDDANCLESEVTGQRTFLFEYDDPTVFASLGRLTKATGPASTVSYRYYPAGALKAKSVEIAGPTTIFIEAYEYDLAERLSTKTLPDGTSDQLPIHRR